ncbi:hypothetical protein ACFT5B_13600 [Luteimicrobium sp. NPDC057192]|uniref:hypothetical protein n=1 Tax=Luteimicrobium sp. NPDC057192 TaxID=3346042 RepID=UPI00363122E8
MMTSWAGPAAVVLFAAWLAYYVPLRVGMRQEVADARTSDRFSGALRVLAVAGRGPVPATAAAAASEGPVVTGGVPLLAMSAQASRGSRGREEAQDVSFDESNREGSRRAVAPATRPAVSPDVRRAAARRRMLLTLGLAGATVLVVVLAGFGLLPWPVVLLPVVLLAGVLALGRRAVLVARRADAARLEAARRRALDARRQALGSPLSPRNAVRTDRRRVTGHAVQASQTATQMIPRITAEDLERARRAAARRAERAERPASSGVPPVDGRETRGAGRPSDRAGETVTAPEGTSSTWEPVPVPPPTYTMKPTASKPPRPPLPEPLPEPTPAPVSAEELAPFAAPGRVRVPAELRTGKAAADVDDAAPRERTERAAEATTTTRAAGDEPSPTTETLGLSLDAILARRRAVGE